MNVAVIVKGYLSRRVTVRHSDTGRGCGPPAVHLPMTPPRNTPVDALFPCDHYNLCIILNLYLASS